MQSERYDGIAILLHWLVAVLIIANIGLAWSLGSFDRHDPVHDRILTVHKSIGTTILLLNKIDIARYSLFDPAQSRSLAAQTGDLRAA